MKVIIEKSDKLDTIIDSVGSKVVTENSEYFYIPAWFEKTPKGDFIFHHMNKLPKDLIDKVEEQKNPKTDIKP